MMNHCLHCDKPTKRAKYCSLQCVGQSRKGTVFGRARTGSYFDCITCGKKLWRQKTHQNMAGRYYCSNKCQTKGRPKKKTLAPEQVEKLLATFARKRNERIGQTYKSSRGYVSVYLPQHPNATGRGLFPQHRYVVEKIIQRYLTREEVVHHINGKITDNNPDNLYIFSGQGAHIAYHRPQDKKSKPEPLRSNLQEFVPKI